MLNKATCLGTAIPDLYACLYAEHHSIAITFIKSEAYTLGHYTIKVCKE